MAMYRDTKLTQIMRTKHCDHYSRPYVGPSVEMDLSNLVSVYSVLYCLS